MTDYGPQPDFHPHWIAELMEALLSALPLLEKLVAMGHRIRTEDATATTALPCHSCAESNCNGPCDRLNTFLGGDYQGRGRRENLTGLFPNTLQEIERIRQQDIFKQYALWKDDFTKFQWPVVELFYNYGLSEERIAKVLGKSRSTINGLLNRAKRIKEEREKRLRRETRNQLRKKEEDNEK